MRRLHLSERRDSFKKQEAVQEVSFDEPLDGSPGLAAGVPQIAVEEPPGLSAAVDDAGDPPGADSSPAGKD